MRSQVNQRLTEICDAGCAIICAPASPDQAVILLENLKDWSDTALEQPSHPSLKWMAETIGIANSSDGATAELMADGSITTPFTLISTYEEGSKIGILAAHSSPELSAVEIRELTAAALVIVRLDRVTAPEEDPVTAKELVYLQQVSGGALDDDIADDLGLSLRAIKERKRKAIEDMHAKNIAHAVAKAKRHDLL